MVSKRKSLAGLRRFSSCLRGAPRGHHDARPEQRRPCRHLPRRRYEPCRHPRLVQRLNSGNPSPREPVRVHPLFADRVGAWTEHSSSRLSQLVPDAVLVSGTAAACISLGGKPCLSSVAGVPAGVCRGAAAVRLFAVELIGTEPCQSSAPGRLIATGDYHVPTNLDSPDEYDCISPSFRHPIHQKLSRAKSVPDS